VGGMSDLEPQNTEESQPAAGAPDAPEMIGDLTREEFDRRRRGRNMAIGLSLVGFVLLIWAIGFLRMGPALFVRPM